MMRTGDATAVATKYPARKDSENLYIVGARYQARYQLLALNDVVKPREVRIADIQRSQREMY